MKKKIALLLVSNLCLIIVAIGIYAAGFEYDKANNLALEPDNAASDFVVMTYGKRWERVAKGIVSAVIILDAIILMVWYRGIQASDRKSLIE
ncbi:MAG: hypothetical protein ABJA02_03825 [Acidobacteriota bacterium]